METAITRPETPQRLAFDPVCGSPLPPLYGANPFCDGGYTYYFCSVMCRRSFINQKDAERTLRGDPGHETGSPRIAAVGPAAARQGMAEGIRAAAIERLRRALIPLAGPDVSLCRIAAERGIFCRGFRRWPDAEFDRRWHNAIGRSTQSTRDRMEKFADLWQLTEQVRCGVPLPCDAAGPGSPCRGWDEFSDEQLAQFCWELTELRLDELPTSGEGN